MAFTSNGALDPDVELANQNQEIFVAECQLSPPPDVDLAVVKSSQTSVANVGQLFPYEFVITNDDNGGSAFDVVLSDTLPLSMTGSVDCPMPECSYVDDEAHLLTCRFAGLPPGGSETITVWVSPDKDIVGTNSVAVTNTVAVTATGQYDTDGKDNIGYFTHAIGPAADLSVRKIGSTTELTTGVPLVYTVTVRNKSGLPATVTLTDTIETDVPYNLNSVTVDEPAANCVSLGAGVITCTSSVALEVGSGYTVIIEISPQQDSGRIVNTAVVKGDLLDPNEDDNVDQWIVGGSSIYLPLILKNK